MRKVLFIGVITFLVYVASTAGIMVVSIYATKDYEVHDAIMTDTAGHIMQVSQARYAEADPEKVLQWSAEELTKMTTVRLPLPDGGLFIGHVSAVAKGKDSMTTYFQHNPFYKSFTVSAEGNPSDSGRRLAGCSLTPMDGAGAPLRVYTNTACVGGPSLLLNNLGNGVLAPWEKFGTKKEPGYGMIQ